MAGFYLETFVWGDLYGPRGFAGGEMCPLPRGARRLVHKDLFFLAQIDFSWSRYILYNANRYKNWPRESIG